MGPSGSGKKKKKMKRNLDEQKCSCLSRTWRERENEQLLITCEINEFEFGDRGSKKWECVTRLFTGRENVAT